MVREIGHEQFLVHRGQHALQAMPGLVPRHEESELLVAIIQLHVEVVRHLTHLIGGAEIG